MRALALAAALVVGCTVGIGPAEPGYVDCYYNQSPDRICEGDWIWQRGYWYVDMYGVRSWHPGHYIPRYGHWHPYGVPHPRPWVRDHRRSVADDPRAVRLARRRMLVTSKPKPKITIPVRGSRRKKGPRIEGVNMTPKMRLGASHRKPK